MEENWDNVSGVYKECENVHSNATEIINTEENCDNISGINKKGENLNQNATGEMLQVENANLDSNSTTYNSSKYNASTNYTDWDPSNNNGHTDDDKLIDNVYENPISTNDSIDDTNTGYSDWNTIQSEDSWGIQNIANNPEHLQDSWGLNDIKTNNYQYNENNGYHESVNGHKKGSKFGKVSNNYPKKDQVNSKPAVPKPTYIPPDFEDNNDLALEAGLNFEKYDKIEVTVSGIDVPRNITSFYDSDLHEIIINNLNKCHYTVPTPIQKYALPIIMHGKDMIASAQTGSGKTAAFVLPILNSLISEPSELIVDYNHCEPQALIMSPTRELAIQICEVATRLSRDTSIKCELLYGGTATYHQKQKILRGVHIIVATPGRLIDFVNRGLITFSSLRFFVLDEADRMLDMGFQLDIERILNDNTMVSSAERSTLMFSATLPEEVQQIAKAYLKSDYISVAVGEVGGACKDVIQTFVEVNKFSKKNELVAMLNETNDCQGTMVFVQEKRQADFIAAFLSELNYPTTSIHGDREQPEREKALRDFRTKKMKILVATAVAARGLDIMGVTTVVNFDLPKTIEEYVHRIGRTGRLGNSGRAVSFYDPAYDHALAPYLVNTLKLADQKIPEFLSQYSGEYHEPLGQFNDIRTDITATSECFEAEESW